MHTETIPLDETNCFSQFFIDYITQKKELSPFYSHFPTIENIGETIKNRRFEDKPRQILNEVLKDQYKMVETPHAVSQNIEAITDSKTFTITTGHQLNIFTGPLYFIYKIITVINACKILTQSYPEFSFVPVYWMASEDHDFEEINHFFLDGKRYEWKTDQKGAVGHFNPAVLKEIAKKLPKGAAFFKEAYEQESLANAVRAYVNYLFGAHGLVVLDADHSKLKAQFRSVMEDDLFFHIPEKKVIKATAALEALGYKTQVHPRHVNFFYLENNIRERIEKTSEGFSVVNTGLSFSEIEMRKQIEEHPERLSPNVVLRPLYQETILPNLAYVGGPSEVIYWLQLKELFNHYKISFPTLMPRNFALIIPKAEKSKWEKAGLSPTDLFLPSEKAFAKWVRTHTKHDLSFAAEIAALKDMESKMKIKVAAVDTTLTQHISGLFSRFEKRISLAEKKLLRAEKRLHEDRRRQIESVKEVLFPDGTLQERRDNFLNFYLQDPDFITSLLHTFDAFEHSMYLIYQQ